jgi:tetratricopeptide (TPR) repeat protein
VRDPIEPDAFERAWLLAELAMLQGAIRPNTTGVFVDRALERFPDEPRFHLARAIVTDQLWPFAGLVGTLEKSTRSLASPAHAADVVSRYEAAAAYPEVRAEALIRLGWFLHRTGRPEEALARFEAADTAPVADAPLAYLRDLMHGQVLVAAGRLDDGVRVLRRAGHAMQGAQSARVALMNALLARGDRAEAEALAETLQTSPAAVTDPWWLYWQGDYRRYPQALRALREMIQ